MYVFFIIKKKQIKLLIIHCEKKIVSTEKKEICTYSE